MNKKLYLLSFRADKLMTFSNKTIFNMMEYKGWKVIVPIVTYAIFKISDIIQSVIIFSQNTILNILIYIVLGISFEYIILSITANFIYFIITKKNKKEYQKTYLLQNRKYYRLSNIAFKKKIHRKKFKRKNKNNPF